MHLIEFLKMTEASLTYGVEATRKGDHIIIDTLWLPPHMREAGKGREIYQQWEDKIPRDVKYLKLMPVDYGQGDPTGFWKKMGFKFVNALWMAKGVNGWNIK